MSERSNSKATILIVDDEREHAQVMCDALDRVGHRCDVTYSLDEAKARLAKKRYDVVVTDLVMEGRRDGLDLLGVVKQLQPAPPVILVTAHGDVPTAVGAMNEGAYGFIEKPLDLEYFRAQVNRAAEKAALQRQNQVLQERLDDQAGFEGIIGSSESMKEVLRTARQVATSDIPVLILGESGTGKELIARAIHQSSRRRRGPLITMNCAGFAESILEDELFGRVKGAFTDARAERMGRFEAADGGTLFLDEIGDMPGNMQAKLLRVLENGEVVRLGSNEPMQVDVRFISATNKDLDEMVAERQFREDLYYRIKGMTLKLPPLRERREDIPLLTHFFIRQVADKYAKQIEGITPEAQRALMSHSWKGNVRELRRVVEQMVVLATDPRLDVANIPAEIRPRMAGDTGSGGTANGGGTGVTIPPGISLDQAERELIRSTLKMTNGNREQAAKVLGIGERTLYRKIKEYGLTE